MKILIVNRPNSREVEVTWPDGRREAVVSVFRGPHSTGRYCPPIADGDELLERAEATARATGIEPERCYLSR